MGTGGDLLLTPLSEILMVGISGAEPEMRIVGGFGWLSLSPGNDIVGIVGAVLVLVLDTVILGADMGGVLGVVTSPITGGGCCI